MPAANRPAAILQLWHDKELKSAWRWFVLSGAVGCVAGIGAIVFYYASAGLSHLCLTGLAGYHPGGPAREPEVFADLGGPSSVLLLMLIILPATGNFLAGWLALRFAPDARGHGTDAALDAYHRKRGEINPKTTVIKLLASALTLGTGGSGGREGPIAQIGAGFGSWLGKVFGMRPMDRRILLAAGLAAGIGAIFRAPLAAALFASEILYRDTEFEAEVLLPAMLSSILAYCIFSFVTGDFAELFTMAGGPAGTIFVFDNPLDLVAYLVLAIVVTLGGVIYVRTFYGIEWVAHRLTRIPALARPAIGGALTGLVGVILFLVAASFLSGGERGPVAHAALSVLGFGYGLLQGLFNPEYAAAHNLVTLTTGASVLIPLLLMIAFGKILTTSLTISSGGSAGVFGPSMVIGGCLGGAVGCFFHSIGWADHPAPFIVLGMAGFFAGVAKTPVSTVIMVSELTGTYRLLLPAMWVCTLSYILLGRNRGVLYRSQPETRADSPAHRGDFMMDVFSGMIVADVVDRRMDKAHPINARLTLSQLVPEVIQTGETYFPVVDDAGRLKGIFSLNDIREMLYDESLGDLVTAMDVATTKVVTLQPEDDLNEAMSRFALKGFEYLPVVQTANGDYRLLGMLSRRALLAEYTERLLALKSGDASVRRRAVTAEDL
ncbi:MAG: chloride channel protein [Planctomycetota bacterium]